MIAEPSATKDLESVAAIVGDGPAVTVWSESDGQITLSISAGKKKWAISAASEPRAASVKMCVDYLLRKLAYAAAVCPRCRGRVARAATAPGTNKTPARGYRCPSCLHSWTDS